MKALRWHAARDLRLEDIPPPGPPEQGEALVEVIYSGVCGTDLNEYIAGPHMIRTKPHPLTGSEPPLALGHEIVGRVAALGSDLPGVSVGDRVAVDPCWRCGTCRWCSQGDYHLCPLGGSVGLASPGGFAEQVLVPSVGLTPLPDSVTYEQAALSEPLAVGLHAVTRGRVGTGDNVLILGAGPIGVAVAICARLAGAAAIYVSEPLPHRRDRMLDLGVTEVFDPAACDVRREVFVRTRRVGPDVVVDATGNPALATQAISTVRRGGNVVLAGIGKTHAQLDLNQVVFYERSVHGSLGYNFDIPRVIDLISTGRLDPSPLVTGQFGLSQGTALFEELTTDPGKHLKVLLTPKE